MAGIKKAGEWELEFIELTASSGRKVRLDEVTIGITFQEDINNNSLVGSVIVNDAINMASYAPIIGQEYLKIKLGTPSLSGNVGTKFNYMENALMVNQIGGRMDIGNGVQGYQLDFSTREVIVNQRTKVTQTLVGSWSQIVQRMLTEKLGCRKTIKIEETVGIKKHLATNIRPFEIIQQAENEARSVKTGEASYYFFETKEAYHFRTLASMYAEPAKMTYEKAIAGKKSNKGVIDVVEDMKSILEFEIAGSADGPSMQRTGAYGSKLIVHDISSKSYQTYTYNLLEEFQEMSTIEGTNSQYAEDGGYNDDYPILSDVEIEPGKRITDYPARTYLAPTSTSGGKDNIYDTEVGYSYDASEHHNWLQTRDSTGTRLDNAMSVTLRVHGNTTLHAGDVVICNLPYTAANKTSANEKYDNLYKGKFLISALRHDFIGGSEKEHIIVMKLVKDSLAEPIGVEDAENYEPVSEKAADVVSEFYDTDE